MNKINWRTAPKEARHWQTCSKFLSTLMIVSKSADSYESLSGSPMKSTLILGGGRGDLPVHVSWVVLCAV